MAVSQRANSVLLLCLISSLTVPTYATLNAPSTITSVPSISNAISNHNPLITQAATLDRALLARGIATCGYISGNGAYPLTCPAGFSCTSTIQDLDGWACCNQIQCVGNYVTCADYGAPLCADGLDASACSDIYTSILSCSDSAAPSCLLYARSTHIGDIETAYSYGCGANGGTVLALATTTDGRGDSAAASTTTDDGGDSAAASTSTNNFPTAPSTQTADGASPSTSTLTSESSPNSSSNSDGGGGSGLNTGSIIGIIIAGIGTIGTLIGAYYAWKAVRRRRDRGGRPMVRGGIGQYSGLEPQYGAPRPVYGPPHSYPAPMYPNGWR